MRNILLAVVGIHLHIVARAALYDNTSTSDQRSRLDMTGHNNNNHLTTSAATTGTSWGTAGTSWGVATSSTQGTQQRSPVRGATVSRGSTIGTGSGSQFNPGHGGMTPGHGQTVPPVRGGTITGAVVTGTAGSRIFGSPGSNAPLLPGPRPPPVAMPVPSLPYPMPVPRPVPVPPLPYPMPVPRPVPTPPQENCRMDVSLTCGLGSARGPDCSTLAPRNTNCQVTAVYTLEICNTGGVEMQLTLANLDPAVGPVVNVLPLLHVNVVPPQSCALLEDVRTIYVCRDVTFSTGIFARANPPNGRYCEDQDQVLFRSSKLIPPPVPVPAPYPVPFPVPAPYPVPVPAPYPVPVPAPYPVPVPAPYPVPVPYPAPVALPPRPYFPPPPLVPRPPPLVYHQPPLVYRQPPPVYHPPPLVYRQPPLVYQQPARTYFQRPPVYSYNGCGNGKGKGNYGGRNCGCESGKGKGGGGGCGGKGGKGKGGKRGRTSSHSYEVLASAAGAATSVYTVATGMMCLLFFSLF